MPLFLASAHPPAVLARGLHAGLKSRSGLPTPLPVRLEGDFYVNAGFIDGLSAPLIRALGLTDVHLRLVARGPISVQWYYLDRLGSIHHFMDVRSSTECNQDAPAIHDLPLPPVFLTEDNVALVFFRVSHDDAISLAASDTELINWCFHAKSMNITIESPKPLLLLSRSLGESRRLIEQHLAHQLHHVELQQHFPDLQFMPMPCLHLYESDADAYRRSAHRLESFAASHPDLPHALTLHHNRFNLGGGGNMCLAVKQSVTDTAHRGDFVMLDSDTLVPFKTLYSTALISAIATEEQAPPAIFTPVIAYRKQPTSVLEAGALFGRGAWQLAEPLPLQPCTYPLHHRADLSDKHAQARLSKSLESDYPPFIYSLYRLPITDDPTTFLPAPFFLRGDDVEYGLHLSRQNVSTSVLGSLLVFQDPKHSPWHEIMAILHSTVILLAYTPSQDLSQLADHLSFYFKARLQAHASIRDLHGLSIYQEVLSRLLSLLPIPESQLLAHFYNPDYYLGLRSVNAPYSRLNYSMAKGISETMPAHSYRELPFLYYPSQPDDEPQPESFLLINHLSETAAVLHPGQVAFSELQAVRQNYQLSLGSMLGALQSLKECCHTLLDRSRIHAHYQDCYKPSDEASLANSSVTR
ncbi:MAG: hypothetical protein WBM08_09795 [Prochlorococcaceae cyanobacterium]